MRRRTPIIPALRRRRQEDQEFKGILGYRVNSKSDWIIGDCLKTNKPMGLRGDSDSRTSCPIIVRKRVRILHPCGKPGMRQML